MIMEPTSTADTAQQQSPAYGLMKRGKRGAAALIAGACCNTPVVATTISQQQQNDGGGDTAAADSALTRCKLLDEMLDVLLNPYDAISEWSNLDWIRWLMASGKTLDEFSSAVKVYDYGTCCGLVWTANYVAYRCRTCSISPCMSLCGDCFKRGDHTGHDFNMFRSQAGGACDCGDTSVMKPDGFCRKHSSTINTDGTSTSTNSGCKQPPADLLRVAERIMPRLLLRLVQYLRENSKIADSRTSTTHVPPGGLGGAGAGMTNQQHNLLLIDLDPFLGMLHEFGALGAAMRRVMTVSLTNERIYRWACDYYSSAGNYNFGSDSSLQQQQQQPQQNIYTIYTDKVRRYYAEAIHQYTASTSLSSSSSSRRQRHSNTTIGDAIHGTNSLSSSEEEDDDDEDDEFGQDDWLVDGQISRRRKNKLNHSSFLQEIVFWTVRYEFPQKMVCFLLNMLPDAAYKEALTEAFVMHYGCVARVLATTRDSDTLSNHIVHISVQLFSNEALATRMVDKLGLLRIMVSSLRRMMTKILIPSTLHDPMKNRHRVVDCSKAVMKEHCYWPLVSDLNNVLSHRPIAVKFMCDDRLLDSWFSYLSMFQGMNVNCRELGHHVEFEPNTYYAAFSAELEASAYPMWAMLSHLTSADTLSLSSRVLRACLKRLRKWLIDVGYYYDQDHGNVCGGTASSSANYNTNASTTIIRRLDDRHQFTFHLPLHRYLAVFLCQAVRAQGARIEDIIPQSSTDDSADRDALLMAIAAHPVRAQSAFYEIMQGAWVRNGLQIKGQAMTYIQSNFCISMVDADIYLLQLCLSELSDANIFMSLILEKFKVYDWMHVVKHGGLPQVMDSVEYDAAPSMEGLLVFLATLIGVRTNLCSDEDYDYCQSQLEMVTLLCVSDKTHSQLMELMPERCGGILTSATTTSSPNTSDGTSRNPPSIDQESPPAMRDFETVLQAVAEYKRPQFEASGNMQQGQYVPLAHVWQKLYDPVHVLLRAVHRRDFQSSMDRYTTFMRSIGMLKQNQNTWPPYRMPQKHHPAYRNPCRALLSKLFHAVVWHCLYRSAVYRDISEHTLSLLIYLLDQAWIFYSNSPVDNKISNNQHQPMDTDPPAKQSASSSSTASSGECSYESPNIKSCPKRKIKITVADASNSDSETTNAKETTLLLLNRWYDNDDLAHNLCTTITHVELPPPYYHYFFGEEATNTTSNATAASTMATNLFDYFTSSVAAAASVASSSSPVNVSHNLEPGNSQQQPNVVPSLATIAGNEIPLASSSIPTRPPFYSLNAAAAATSSTMADSALNRVKQRLQFLRPPPPKTDSPTHDQHQSSSSSSVIIDLTVPEFPFEAVANNDNEASILGVDSNVVIEVDDQQNSLVCINESIISLLLKLHSQLSGEPDSYQLPIILPHPTSSNNLIDEANQSASENDNIKEEVPPCGNGAFFVGRLLDRIARGSTSCYDYILRTRVALWPIAVVMRETASRDDEERERRERKRRARDKQQQMMEEMARAQQAFLESARRSGDLDSTDTQSTCATSTIMECDVPPPTVDISTSTTSVNEASTSTLANTLVELDENSSSSNSTTTTKESATHIRGPDQHETMLTVDCVICNQTVIVQIEQQRQDPVGLVILVQGTNVLAHRRHIVSQPLESTNLYNANNSNTTERHQQKLQDTEKATGLTISNKVENKCLVNSEQNYYHYWPALPPLNSQQHHQQSTSVINDPKLQQQHNQPIVTTIADNYDATTYASHSDRRKRLLSQYFNNLDMADFEVGSLTTTTSATPVGGNVHVQTCGHHLHLRCWSSYLASLRGAQRFNSDRGEYSCPLCRQLANSLMPLIPEVTIEQNQQQHGSTPYNTIITMSAMSDAVNKLTELVKQQEYESPNPVQSSDAVCCSEKSTSVFIGETENIVNRHPLHQNVHHHRFNDDDYFMMQNQVHDIIPAGGVEDGNGGNVGEAEDLESGEDPLLNAVNRCVSDMITTTVVTAAAQTVSLPHTLLTSTQREKMYKVRWHSVVSIAWMNIQVELVQRNNSLIELLKQGQSSLHRGNNNNRRLNLFSATAVNATDINGSNNYYNMLPKRNCIAPLLKVLRVSARSLMAKYQTPDYNPISDIWDKLIGCEQPRQQFSSTYPPLLMRDPCSVLLQLVLLLPTLDRDLFDTLIKLTYNMQLYVAALKVASTWNRNCKFNRQFYHRQRHCSSLNTKKISTRNEERTDGSSSVQMDLDDGYNNKLSSLSMDITKDDNTLPLTPLFSQVVALAKTIVFLSDDDETEIVNIGSIVNNDDEFMMHQEDVNVENIVSDSKFDGSINASEDDGEILLLLESYGRRSTLPFLRFAALLKKYINGDDDDNIDDHPELTISSPQLNNLIVEQNKQREQPLDCQVISPPQVEVDCNVDFSTTNDNCHHQHWSNDDYEYLMLARYLKLLNNNEEAHEVSDHYEETYKSNCSYIERNDYQNQSNFEKRHIPLQPPSAMEAVIWPEWSYSTNDKNNKISTTISRTWFTSFRESLTTKIPKATIVGENSTTIVSSAAAEIDPNSKATTSANIIMATRMLLFADCCDSGGASDDTRASILGNSRSLFPPITWAGPRLLKLPHLYDDVFQYYHGRTCHRCHGVPRETSVCLVCGTVVCLKENCCKTNHIYEAVQHSLECGGGTGMFLVVTSSSVVVIRGKRACLWGSVYLDAFGEEDRELKRGKPLYLSAERYRLLEHQWLAHRFDHTNKKWVWHRDAL